MGLLYAPSRVTTIFLWLVLKKILLQRCEARNTSPKRRKYFHVGSAATSVSQKFDDVFLAHTVNIYSFEKAVGNRFANEKLNRLNPLSCNTTLFQLCCRPM